MNSQADEQWSFVSSFLSFSWRDLSFFVQLFSYTFAYVWVTCLCTAKLLWTCLNSYILPFQLTKPLIDSKFSPLVSWISCACSFGGWLPNKGFRCVDFIWVWCASTPRRIVVFVLVARAVKDCMPWTECGQELQQEIMYYVKYKPIATKWAQ